MAELLLHKEPLTESQVAKLEEMGVVAIQVTDPTNFHFVSARTYAIPSDDFLWATLDAIEKADDYKANQVLARNLSQLAREIRAQKGGE